MTPAKMDVIVSNVMCHCSHYDGGLESTPKMRELGCSNDGASQVLVITFPTCFFSYLQDKIMTLKSESNAKFGRAQCLQLSQSVEHRELSTGRSPGRQELYAV